MADIICVIGNRPGTGKTTVSHMLAHGLSLCGHAPVYMAVEIPRNQPQPRHQRYACLHSPDEAALSSRIAQLRSQETGPGIVDGSSSRKAAGSLLYDMADLVIIPFRDSAADLQSMLRELQEFPRAYLLPCQWPTNPWRRRSADRLLGEALGHYRDRILQPVPANTAAGLLLKDSKSDGLAAMPDALCRDIAVQVAGLLNIRLRIDTGAPNLASARKKQIAA